MSETAILVSSDYHYGKKTKSFNPGVLGQRLKTLSDTLNRIPSEMKGTGFDRLVPLILGDVNDGTDIYATQSHEQAVSNVEKQADAVSDMTAEFITSLQREWTIDSVYVTAGNHGRAGHAAIAANWDIVAYRYLGLKMRGTGPRVVMPPEDGSPFFNSLNVRGHKFLLHHGNAVRCYQQIPWYGMVQKALKWNITSLGPFDTLLMGHYHTPGHQRINSLSLYTTGSAVSDDAWALTEMGLESTPAWWLLTVTDDGEIGWSKAISLN